MKKRCPAVPAIKRRPAVPAIMTAGRRLIAGTLDPVVKPRGNRVGRGSGDKHEKVLLATPLTPSPSEDLPLLCGREDLV